MMTLLFVIVLIAVFAKILKFAVKAAWGISKVVVSVVLLPLFLVLLVLKGLMELAFPLLVIIGVISLFALRE